MCLSANPRDREEAGLPGELQAERQLGLIDVETVNCLEEELGRTTGLRDRSIDGLLRIDDFLATLHNCHSAAFRILDIEEQQRVLVAGLKLHEQPNVSSFLRSSWGTSAPHPRDEVARLTKHLVLYERAPRDDERLRFRLP